MDQSRAARRLSRASGPVSGPAHCRRGGGIGGNFQGGRAACVARPSAEDVAVLLTSLVQGVRDSLDAGRARLFSLVDEGLTALGRPVGPDCMQRRVSHMTRSRLRPRNRGRCCHRLRRPDPSHPAARRFWARSTWGRSCHSCCGSNTAAGLLYVVAGVRPLAGAAVGLSPFARDLRANAAGFSPGSACISPAAGPTRCGRSSPWRCALRSGGELSSSHGRPGLGRDRGGHKPRPGRRSFGGRGNCHGSRCDIMFGCCIRFGAAEGRPRNRGPSQEPAGPEDR